MFLIYINDLQNSLVYSNALLFADDTAVCYACNCAKKLNKRINIDLKLLSHWLSANKIALNVAKTEVLLFRDPRKRLEYNIKLKLQGKQLRFISHTKYLGIYIDKHLNWKQQQESLAMSLRKANGVISKLRHFVNRETLTQIYYALFHSHMTYGLQVWGQSLPNNNRIYRLQKTALRLMTFSETTTPTKPLFRSFKILTLNDLLFLSNIKLVHDILKGKSPRAIIDTLDLNYISNRITTRAISKNLLKTQN